MLNATGVPGRTVNPDNGSNVVPDNLVKYAFHEGGRPSNRGINNSEMLPVLMISRETLPHSPGVAPLLEIPRADTLYSLLLTFWSYTMTMSSMKNPISVPDASDVNSNLNCDVL